MSKWVSFHNRSITITRQGSQWDTIRHLTQKPSIITDRNFKPATIRSWKRSSSALCTVTSLTTLWPCVCLLNIKLLNVCMHIVMSKWHIKNDKTVNIFKKWNTIVSCCGHINRRSTEPIPERSHYAILDGLVDLYWKDMDYEYSSVCSEDWLNNLIK